jgi:hypothetical protein
MAPQNSVLKEVIHQATSASGLPKAVRVRKVFHLKTPNRFSDHAAFMLGKTLVKDKTLTSLEICLNRLSQTHQQLLDCITLSRRLEQITLKGSRLGKILVPGKIASDFLEAISMSRNIHQITLYKLEIKPNSLIQLLTSKSLPIRKLEILDSDFHHASPKNPQGIASALGQHRTIETIAYRAFRSTKAQLAQVLNRPQLISSSSLTVPNASSASYSHTHGTIPPRKDPPDYLFQSVVQGLPSQSTVRKLILDLRKDDIETFHKLHKALETNTSITKIVWNQPSSSASLPYSKSELEQIQGYLERNQQLLREQDHQSLWLPENQRNHHSMIERVLVEYGRWKIHHPYIAWPSATLVPRKRIPLPTKNKIRESLTLPSVTLHKLE